MSLTNHWTRSPRLTLLTYVESTPRARSMVPLRGFLKALMDALLALLDGSRFGGAC
jgi:hypothetical protein